MINVFGASFSTTLFAVLDIFIVIAAAGLLVRRGLVSQAQISGLSSATVNIFLPSLIFSKVIRTLDPSTTPLWWAIPLVAIVLSALALGLSAAVFAHELPAKRNVLPLACMQNAGYLVLPIGLSLYPTQFDTFALYCFLFILGFNPVLWSVGKLLSTGDTSTAETGDGPGSGWKGLLTPPLIANLAAIAVALSGSSFLIPDPVIHAVELMGSAAVPVATFILGAVLGSVPIQLRPYLGDASRALVVKLVLLPALMVLLLQACLRWLPMINLDPLLARFLVIEAAAAPAAGIILMVRSYGGDEAKIGSIMLASYALCTLTLPMWVAVWSMLE